MATASNLPAPLPAVADPEGADAVPDDVPEAAPAVGTICPFDVAREVVPEDVIVLLLGVCVACATTQAALPVIDGV
jgi:hypothetical protein